MRCRQVNINRHCGSRSAVEMGGDMRGGAILAQQQSHEFDLVGRKSSSQICGTEM